jgi:hypothetical protein
MIRRRRWSCSTSSACSAAGAAYSYAAVLAYTLSASFQRGRLGEHGHATHLLPVKRMRWFPTFLSFADFSRIAWLVLSNMHMFQWVEGSAPDFRYEHMVFVTPLLPTDIDIDVLGAPSFGKLATLLYFSAFTLLFRFWEDERAHARRTEKPLARVSESRVAMVAPSAENSILSNTARSGPA